LSEVLKVLLVAGRWFTSNFHGRYYGRAQHAARALRAAYDGALARYDLLLMPTVPSSAAPHPAADSTREVQFARAVEGTPNAAPFDVTGHPAMSLSCGTVADMPVGLMLIGRHFAEHDIYRVASAIERVRDAGANVA
jgi:amidase